VGRALRRSGLIEFDVGPRQPALRAAIAGALAFASWCQAFHRSTRATNAADGKPLSCISAAPANSTLYVIRPRAAELPRPVHPSPDDLLD